MGKGLQARSIYWNLRAKPKETGFKDTFVPVGQGGTPMAGGK